MNETLSNLVNNYNYIPNSAWVTFPEFDSLYVRVGPIYYNNSYIKSITIANVIASNPGNGSFKRLLTFCKNNFPSFSIHVENVMTTKFSKGLIKLGFTETAIKNCFIKI